MIYELAQATLHKIFQDKIILGLVIVGILAVFVGGFGNTRVPSKTQSLPVQAPPTQDSQNSASPSSVAESNTNKGPMDPALARDFVKWWLNGAVDYNPTSASQSHMEAMGWVTQETVPAYQATFWSPDIAAKIESGQAPISFHLISVEPVALNPDGSVVISVKGERIFQDSHSPAIEKCNISLLVRHDLSGLRIAGLYNNTVTTPGSSIY